jgi:acyl-CoA thioesterase-1
MIRIGICIVAALAQLVTAQAQDAPKKRAAKKVNPVFVAPKDDPSLPYVLIIGDSISIGYTLDVRRELKGVANVYRPPTNCGPTTKGLEEIDSWLGDRKWDVVHWNHGLHDLKYMGPKGQNLADPKAPTSHPQVPIEEYAANIERLAKRIKQSANVVIWRETTPVPEGAAGRVVGDSAKYNAAATKAIAKVGGIQTDPFFAFAESVKEQQRPANVHYTPEGSKLLGNHVAEVIRTALEEVQ